MAIFKCKMCGGELEINENETFVTCKYCGSPQVISQSDVIKETNVMKETESLEYEHNKEIDDKKHSKGTEKSKKIVALTVFAICAFICLIIISFPFLKYCYAVSMIKTGNMVKAYDTLISLDGYKDSVEKADSIYYDYKLEKIKLAKIGDYVSFGAYEQDNDLSDGKEDIEWLVLDVKDGKALVISKYALDYQIFDKVEMTDNIFYDTSWATCTLRKWLNDDFIKTAFSEKERSFISLETVLTDTDLNYSNTVDQGENTEDWVFILSTTEFNKYLSTEDAKQCKATDYALIKNGMENFGSNWYCRWWLRTLGDTWIFPEIVTVDSSGELNEEGDPIDYEYLAVRPAMWIDLTSID